MHKLVPCLPLSTGTGRMPQIAYGTGTTWFSKEEPTGIPKPINRALVESITTSIRLGFRHLDGAEMYGTERELGAAIREATASGLVSREELFITSKVLKGAADVPAAARSLLERMQLDRFDLFLIHAPFLPEGVTLKEAWAGMESLVDAGLARSIGVSNFRIQDLEELLGIATIKPSVNQIEYHPYLQQPELCAFCREHSIIPVGYSSLVPLIHSTGGPVDAAIQEIAQKHGKTPEQVLLRWVMQKGHGAVTTSKSADRLSSFLQAAASPIGAGGLEQGAFQLDDDEVERIDKAGEERKFRKYWAQQLVD